jgi:hypothetical protein
MFRTSKVQREHCNKGMPSVAGVPGLFSQRCEGGGSRTTRRRRELTPKKPAAFLYTLRTLRIHRGD